MSKQIRLLQIEDSKGDAELVLRTLTREGFNVFALRVDDRESLRHALEHPAWDVVICDYHLPGLKAPAALAIIRQHDPNVPCIVVSGSARRQEVETEVLNAGACEYIDKNQLAWLVPAVERALRAAAAKREGTMEQRWIPSNSTTVLHIDGGRTATVYIYPTHSGMAAVAYRGDAVRPAWHKIFDSDELLNAQVGLFFQEFDKADGKPEVRRRQSALGRTGSRSPEGQAPHA